MEAATRLVPLRSDLAAAAGPSLGSAKEPALTPGWRRPVGYQRHVPVLPVRPHDARARARTLVALINFASADLPRGEVKGVVIMLFVCGASISAGIIP
jgi:hypothetical protein